MRRLDGLEMRMVQCLDFVEKSLPAGMKKMRKEKVQKEMLVVMRMELYY